jgi:cytosolic carboxypeptidase protein 2/3
MYSNIDASKLGKGWQRAGKDVCYYQNSMKKKTQGHYFTLTFSIQFTNDNDCVYFAHSYPYTYSDLIRYIGRLESDPKKKTRFRKKEFCKTVAGNPVDMMIITTFGSDFEEMKKRKGVVISSRVHPGETNSSFMMKGVIDYLLGPSLGARMLRDTFVFKIVPMLNPDGVINGNTRCNLTGVDLNRSWLTPDKKLHPTIYHMK